MKSQQSNAASAGAAGAAYTPGLLDSLASMAKNTFGLLFSRIELAALELAEVRSAALNLALILAGGIVVAWFSVAFWTALIVVLSWESMGWKILLILAVFFTSILIAILLYVRSMLSQGRLSMPATMAELRNDRDALL